MTKNSIFVLLLTLFVTTSRGKSIFVINSEQPDTSDDKDKDELVSVVVLYRHGDRSPISSYPDDPYIDISYWPEGYGELLNKGKERQYELGEWLRQRYDTFLPRQYSPKDIRVVSSDVDRTLMSAASNLAGFYPITLSEIWNDNLLWEPIPIHILAPHDDDEILAMAKRCPKGEQLQEEVDSLDYFKNVTTENADIFQYISTKVGINVTLADIENIYNVFYVYRNHNPSYIPSWADSLDQQTFSFLAGLEFAKPTFTDELKRLTVGPFFNYLIGYLDDIVNNVTDTPKFLMLSAHDTTIASVLNGMGAYDNWPPEFAATVFWELHRTSEGEHYINLLYRRNTTNPVEELVVDGCSFNCTYDDFKNTLVPITVNTTVWEEECSLSNAKRLMPYWLLFLTSLLLWLYRID